MEEIWKDVVGYEGSYLISNFGRVKSIERIIFTGRRYYPVNERILVQTANWHGYLCVALVLNGKLKTKVVHQMVAESFLNHVRCGHKLVINHIDFNKNNNRLDNLEIVTTRENTNQKHIPHSSKYVGVTKIGDKWYSHISHKRKNIYLGTFDNEEEASLYRENALIAINNGTPIIKKLKEKKTKQQKSVLRENISKEKKIRESIRKNKKSSQYRGVSWSKKYGWWVSQIFIDGKTRYIGNFKNEFDAHLAYENKLKELISA